MTRINLKSVASSEPVPAGTYDATFTEWEKRRNADDSGEHFSMQFTLTENEFKGRKVYRNYSLKPEALIYFKTFLARLGTPDDALEDEEAEIEDILNDLKGADCRVKVRVRKWQGENRNEVQGVLSALDGTDEDDSD